VNKQANGKRCDEKKIGMNRFHNSLSGSEPSGRDVHCVGLIAPSLS
jgi:hypothetical protein